MLSKRFAEYRRFGVTALMAGLVAVAACDDDPLDPNDPSNFGEVEVDVTTTGYEPDFVDYTVSFQGGGAVDADPTSNTVLVGVPEGSHDIVLGGVPAHCTPDANPKQVSVTAGDRSDVSFTVTCTAITGSLTPAFAITGEEADRDPTVTVTPDVGDAFEVNTAAPEEVFHLEPGDRTLTLSNLDPNCTAVATEVIVPVTAGQANPVQFAFDCVPNVGDLNVTITTIGDDQDGDYEITIDEEAPVAASDGDNLISDVRVGQRGVVIGGVADNCNVVGGDTKTAVIAFGEQTDLAVSVNCTAIAPPE
jgi:hypothetical protein